MANTRSAKKMIRVATRRRRYNRPIRSAFKSHIARAQKLLQAGDREPAIAAVTTALRQLDKAAQKGIIHKNNAARRKSRLMKKLNASAMVAGS